MTTHIEHATTSFLILVMQLICFPMFSCFIVAFFLWAETLTFLRTPSNATIFAPKQKLFSEENQQPF